MKHCARKGALIKSPTGIGAGLGEHLAPMERPDKIPIGDRGLGRGLLIGFGDGGWPLCSKPALFPFLPTIPPSPDYTPASPDYSPASDMEFDPSEDPSSDYHHYQLSH
ncbi:hypothetical protein Tco_0744266 [Tanacetum coccineum]